MQREYDVVRKEYDNQRTVIDKLTEEKQDLVSDVESAKQRIYQVEGLLKESENEKNQLQKELSDTHRRLMEVGQFC